MAKRPAINVYMTANTSKQWSRLDIMSWINDLLKCEMTKIEDFCTGAAYCNAMDMLFPGAVKMAKVKFVCNQEYEYGENFRVLQLSFMAAQVNTPIPINQLVKGRFQDNYKFAIWFRQFFEANVGGAPKNYDPLKARGYSDIGIGQYEKIKNIKMKPAAKKPQQLSKQDKLRQSQQVDEFVEKKAIIAKVKPNIKNTFAKSDNNYNSSSLSATFKVPPFRARRGTVPKVMQRKKHAEVQHFEFPKSDTLVIDFNANVYSNYPDLSSNDMKRQLRRIFELENDAYLKMFLKIEFEWHKVVANDVTVEIKKLLEIISEADEKLRKL